VAKAVLGTVKNLRSAVQKSALLCLCDLLDAYADQLLPVLAGPQGGAPALAPIQQVLLKASQDKRFVADEAQRALRTLAEKCTPADAQALLVPLAAHKSPKVCVCV
jgi:heparan-alpha-glucosaminide N-acetyltransferase